MEFAQVIPTIVGLLPLLGVLGVLRKAFKKLTKKRTLLKSEEEFFKNTFLVDFIDEKRKGIRNMIIYLILSFGIFSILFLLEIFPLEHFPIDVDSWYVIPLMIFIYFLAYSYFVFDMRKMPIYESALESENITVFLKRTLEKKDIEEEKMIDKLKKLYDQCEESETREETKKIEEKIFKELK